MEIMTKDTFEEIEKINLTDPMQLCFELFCEEKQKIPLDQFNQLFGLWVSMFREGGIQEAIKYFKNNKVK